MGFTPTPILQVDGIDIPLRNLLWSALYSVVGHLGDREFKLVTGSLWLQLFKEPIDLLPSTRVGVLDWIRDWFFAAEWNRAYDLIEFVVQHLGPKRDAFVELCNLALERDNAGYRIVGRCVMPIMGEVETTAIDEAMSAGHGTPTAKHLASAADLLRDREAPDYRNSIKESISAVEAACRQVTGKSNATLGDALKWLDRQRPGMLHPALGEGLSKIYGYTSDAKGIRHALTDGHEPPSFDEAKFMLVACSAFVNLLVAASA